MKAQEISFYEWQRRFSSEAACTQALAQLRWPDGFQCAQCGHDHGWHLKAKPVVECSRCGRQTSVTAGTLMHGTKLPLVKWFWAIYWMASDKGGISALRLSKLIDVHWRTAYRMLRRLRIAMGHRDSLYRLERLVEFDDAFVGGYRPGKAGRGAANKTALLVACENRADDRPGFASIQAVSSINSDTVTQFARKHLQPGQDIRSDALPALRTLGRDYAHVARVTPPIKAKEWLPWVHTLIANLKRFLLGTFHGIRQHRVQEYVNEFVYRFNRRFFEQELPHRLLRLAMQHTPINLA